MAATVRGDRRDDDLVSGTPFDLAAAQNGRNRSRVPEILVGTLVVAVFALAGAWFYTSSTERVAYLAVRQPIERGAIVAREDLTSYEINTEGDIRAVRAQLAPDIIGKVALVDLEEGALITAGYFADKALIPPGFGVVGLDLAPGEFPSFSLSPGDRVRVVITPPGSQLLGEGEQAEVIEDVEVVAVSSSGRDRFISLTMSTAEADRVVIADAQERVRLIQIPGN